MPICLFFKAIDKCKMMVLVKNNFLNLYGN